MNQEQLETLARLGARARVEELRQELEALTQAFPDLGAGERGGRGRGRRGRSSEGAASETRTAGRTGRRRRRMSPAARRAVSERMKRYWAERRKEKSAKRG